MVVECIILVSGRACLTQLDMSSCWHLVAYIFWTDSSSLVQVKFRCKFGAKPAHELKYWPIVNWSSGSNMSDILITIQNVYVKKTRSEISFPICQPSSLFRPGFTLQWRHNERGGVSNHQPHDVHSTVYSRRRSTKTSTLRATGLCAGNSPVVGEFPTQRASNAENVSIWWRHHETPYMHLYHLTWSSNQVFSAQFSGSGSRAYMTITETSMPSAEGTSGRSWQLQSYNCSGGEDGNPGVVM